MQENEVEKVVCKMAAILSGFQYVDVLQHLAMISNNNAYIPLHPISLNVSHST